MGGDTFLRPHARGGNRIPVARAVSLKLAIYPISGCKNPLPPPPPTSTQADDQRVVQPVFELEVPFSWSFFPVLWIGPCWCHDLALRSGKQALEKDPL